MFSINIVVAMGRNEMTMQVVPDERVAEFLALYDRADFDVAGYLCDRHEPSAVAYTIVADDLSSTTLTYGALRQDSEKLADSFVRQGFKRGDRIATLMGKGRSYLVSILAIWRIGAVHVPLFTAFAPPAILMRLRASGARLVICDAAQNQKLEFGTEENFHPSWKVVTTGTPGEGELSFDALLSEGRSGFGSVAIGGASPFIQIYTSGTTGTPKGVAVPAKALASFHAYGEFALDLRPDDIFWNAADPGWAYGLYFGVLVTLSTGVPSVMLTTGFSAELTFAVLSRFGVTNLTAAPTVYRSLLASGDNKPKFSLRCASSAGEPLTPEVNARAGEALGALVHDHFGQTEAGMLVNNHHHPDLRKPLKTGSMGQVTPGWSLAILHMDKDEIAPAGTVGRLAFELAGSPFAWFEGYIDEPGKTREKFAGDGRWYVSGDTARMDEDGYIFFSARDDDIIIMAGYRIGPFEVESVLVTHPAVAEAAAVAVPDTVRGEVLEAAVVLHSGYHPSEALVKELQSWVKTKFAAHAYPRRVHFIEALPKTPSGKIQRFVVRKELREVTLSGKEAAYAS